MLFSQVFLTKWKNGDRDPPVKIENEKLFIRDVDGKWIPIRAAYRYVTQKPWNRIPTSASKTLFFNPVVCCLAGGRNKMCADKAYEFFNHKNFKDGLAIRTPITIRDVQKREV